MNEHFKSQSNDLESIMGLGERSYRKSYYPELQQRIFELERFRDLLSQTNDMIFLIRIPEGHPVYTSQSVSVLLGYSSEELQVNTFQELLPLGTSKWVKEFFAEPGLNFGKPGVLVTSLRRRGGEELPVEMTLRLVAYENVNYAVAVARDITERKQAEDELRKSHDELEKRVADRTAELFRINRELEKSNQALQEFTSVASHDLQEPVRKIEFFSELLKKECGACLENKGLDYLGRLQNASRRMRTLIQSLLAYSRVAIKTEPFTRVDLNEILKSVLSDLEVSVNAENGTVEVGNLPIVNGDPLQLHQLLQNLIGNALKYHGESSPTIRIYGGAVDDEYCEVHIRDNGIGFDEIYTERIFDPFVRLHGRSSQYEGTGMGLAICRKIVERHGGSIKAKSASGKGTTFIVALRIHKA